jgi:hypothetical protein
MPPEVAVDSDGQDRDRYSPFAWDVFSLAMVRDGPALSVAALGGPVAKADGGRCVCVWIIVVQVLYFMWTGRHPLDVHAPLHHHPRDR